MGKDKISLVKRFMPVILFALAFVIFYIAFIYATGVIPMAFLCFIGAFVILEACDCIDKINNFGKHGDNDDCEENHSGRESHGDNDDFPYPPYFGSSDDSASGENHEENFESSNEDYKNEDNSEF